MQQSLPVPNQSVVKSRSTPLVRKIASRINLQVASSPSHSNASTTQLLSNATDPFSADSFHIASIRNATSSAVSVVGNTKLSMDSSVWKSSTTSNNTLPSAASRRTADRVDLSTSVTKRNPHDSGSRVASIVTEDAPILADENKEPNMTMWTGPVGTGTGQCGKGKGRINHPLSRQLPNGMNISSIVSAAACTSNVVKDSASNQNKCPNPSVLMQKHPARSISIDTYSIDEQVAEQKKDCRRVPFHREGIPVPLSQGLASFQLSRLHKHNPKNNGLVAPTDSNRESNNALALNKSLLMPKPKHVISDEAEIKRNQKNKFAVCVKLRAGGRLGIVEQYSSKDLVNWSNDTLSAPHCSTYY